MFTETVYTPVTYGCSICRRMLALAQPGQVGWPLERNDLYSCIFRFGLWVHWGFLSWAKLGLQGSPTSACFKAFCSHISRFGTKWPIYFSLPVQNKTAYFSLQYERSHAGMNMRAFNFTLDSGYLLQSLLALRNHHKKPTDLTAP